MKKLIPLLTGAIMLLSLAACGGADLRPPTASPTRLCRAGAPAGRFGPVRAPAAIIANFLPKCHIILPPG